MRKVIVPLILLMPLFVEGQLMPGMGEASAGEAFKYLKDLLDAAKDQNELYESVKQLSSGECTPDFSTSSDAIMITSCEGKGCDCLKDAIATLDFNRQQLARVKCIYNDTKGFDDDAIAFGNTWAQMVGVGGLQWNVTRQEIEAAFKNFVTVCANKHKELMGNVQSALMKINDCEKEMGEENWYQKYGFLYYNFLDEAYKTGN